MSNSKMRFLCTEERWSEFGVQTYSHELEAEDWEAAEVLAADRGWQVDGIIVEELEVNE